jgi:hypothetical protein
MKLQTQLELQPGKPPLHYQHPVVLLGSCFAAHIGEKLDYYKFRATVNPFGILFHPEAIKALVERAAADRFYGPDEVFFHNERWHCFDAHSDLSNPSKEELLLLLNARLSAMKAALNEASHIIITLGTAWGYKRKTTGAWVANCHKVPQKEFDKELSAVPELTATLEKIVGLLQKCNSGVSVIFSVSPVRHLKDGFVENQRSKAHLIAAVHQCLEKGKGTSYFPAYEIMMDELRDYRFYAADMIHPNELAIAYIWEKFKKAWISEAAYGLMEAVGSIQKSLSHKPFHAGSAQHKAFEASLQERIRELEQAHPYLAF